jgi:hypothetical protein
VPVAAVHLICASRLRSKTVMMASTPQEHDHHDHNHIRPNDHKRVEGAHSLRMMALPTLKMCCKLHQKGRQMLIRRKTS